MLQENFFPSQDKWLRGWELGWQSERYRFKSCRRWWVFCVHRLKKEVQKHQETHPTLRTDGSEGQRRTLNPKVGGSNHPSGSDWLLSPTAREEKDEGTRRTSQNTWRVAQRGKDGLLMPGWQVQILPQSMIFFPPSSAEYTTKENKFIFTWLY